MTMQKSLKKAPIISSDLLEQLRRVAPSTDGMMEYRPCLVRLKDSRELDRVYVVEEDAYLSVWGVYPEDDHGKSSVNLNDVASIEDSPTRLPAAIANRIYEAGESGMGYCTFHLVLRDGRALSCVTGNAVDFVNLPPGVTSDVIVDVRHERVDTRYQYCPAADYHWCLYRLPE